MDIIKEDAFRKQLKKGLSGAYLFFGDEDYLKNFSLKVASPVMYFSSTPQRRIARHL